MYVCIYECLYVSNRLGVGETDRLPPVLIRAHMGKTHMAHRPKPNPAPSCLRDARR